MSNNLDDKLIRLDGDLHLKIVRARGLSKPFFFSRNVLRCFPALDCQKLVTSNRQWGHHLDSKINSNGLYVSVNIHGILDIIAARTQRISNSQNPVWKQNFKIPLARLASEVKFLVEGGDPFSRIGEATVPAKRIATGEVIDEWFRLQVKGTFGKRSNPVAVIRLQMAFLPYYKNPIYLKGIRDRENYGLKESYFPRRHEGKVTLYQDAHVSDGMLPEIMLDEGRKFEHQHCWEDMCHAILEAKFLVYIMGWSIYHKVRLVREPPKPLPNGRDFNLGELLKYKSDGGVKVLLLLYNDGVPYIGDRVRRAHNEETCEFFKDSSVTCVLSEEVPRRFFIHNQKCVIVDTQDHGSNRKITAFLGGLDLGKGCYDTPEHRLFRDLDTVFKGDYHNPTFPRGKRAPRQPWHDLHCKIEGPAVYDVLTNFEQRWGNAARWSKKTPEFPEDALLKIEDMSFITSPSPTIPNENPSSCVSKEDDPENWHVQVFRSIDCRSLEGFPEDADKAKEMNLLIEEYLVVDRSIQRAYIQAIRSAKHFIYIETQRLNESPLAWAHRPGRLFHVYDNEIPNELALKITSKIKAKERFTVYVVMPMWPEGDPTSTGVQEILYRQGEMMEDMYAVIALEIKSAQLENAHPTDYLNFYCLGNREELQKEEPNANGQTSSDRNNDLASKKFGRSMIYVHGNGMIVDDEYVILGSANMTAKSMAGSKNTEIAMGAYQPHYTWNKKKRNPRGQVYGYRMSLWSEHIGPIKDCFEDPENLDCVKYVNDVAKDNWKRYISDEFTPLQGHILKYPIDIDANGNIQPLPGHENFPDVGGNVLGY